MERESGELQQEREREQGRTASPIPYSFKHQPFRLAVCRRSFMSIASPLDPRSMYGYEWYGARRMSMRRNDLWRGRRMRPCERFRGGGSALGRRSESRRSATHRVLLAAEHELVVLGDELLLLELGDDLAHERLARLLVVLVLEVRVPDRKVDVAREVDAATVRAEDLALEARVDGEDGLLERGLQLLDLGTGDEALDVLRAMSRSSSVSRTSCASRRALKRAREHAPRDGAARSSAPC